MINVRKVEDELTLYEIQKMLQKKQERHMYKRNRFMFVDLKPKM